LATCFSQKKLCINFDQKRVGLHFGRFFNTNSSGHPESRHISSHAGN
jgi:hypothetical protein